MKERKSSVIGFDFIELDLYIYNTFQPTPFLRIVLQFIFMFGIKYVIAMTLAAAQ